MIEFIRKIARNLLESGIVKVVIGYEKGTGGMPRPVFITNPDKVNDLVYDADCNSNLAVYLFKEEVKQLGKPAIVASIPVLRTLNLLISENQLIEGNLYVIAVTSEGQVIELDTLKKITSLISKYSPDLSSEEREKVEKIEKMTPEERWKFWVSELSNCTKCYACRAACPLCYCPRCTVDNNEPQWISVPTHPLGNMEWHVMRAMHLAGRCSNCGECFRACPVKIPLNLLTQKILYDIKNQFSVSKENTGKDEYPLSIFKPDDRENFIR
jgi:ferredoxin